MIAHLNFKEERRVKWITFWSNGLMTRKLAYDISLAGVVLLCLTSVNAQAQAGTRTFAIQGIPATGLNDLCGEPLFTLPLPPPLDTAHFTFVGAFDPTPDAREAMPLSPANCSDDIILATTIDPTFQ